MKTVTIKLPDGVRIIQERLNKIRVDEESAMDASFTIDLNTKDDLKPLPYVLRKRKQKSERIFLPNEYGPIEVEFFDMIKECAEYIDKINDVAERTKYHKDLSKIFVGRSKMAIMRLYRELVNKKLGSNL